MKRLVVLLSGPLQLPLSLVDAANVVEGGSDFSKIAHLFIDGQGLFIIRQCLLQFLHISITLADIVEDDSLFSKIAHLLIELQSMFKVAQSLRHLSLRKV